MPGTVVTLYIDYKSPYAFVAKAGAYALEEDYDVSLRWLPYTLNIPSYLGSVEDRTPHQWRRVKYSYMDARRFANKQGLTLRGPQKIYDSRLAGIGMLYAQRAGVFRRYNDIVFERFWKRELDIESLDALSAVLAEAGADPSGFRAFAEGPGGEEHDRIRAEAEEAGVFGVPMFVVDGELFWGGDRLPQVREKLAEMGLARAR
ncbi:MAG: DsbA family protein [Rhodospirillales bacterium]|nr:DsbA family protein [Rhodospirillales bacterium]